MPVQDVKKIRRRKTRKRRQTPNLCTRRTKPARIAALSPSIAGKDEASLDKSSLSLSSDGVGTRAGS
jgi:hypothetical protein